MMTVKILSKVVNMIVLVEGGREGDGLGERMSIDRLIDQLFNIKLDHWK